MTINGKKTESAGSDGASHSPLAYLRRPYFVRSRRCPLTSLSKREINYKNTSLLLKFVSEGGRILPSRMTSVSKLKQRLLSNAIKRARFLAILPYCDGHKV